MLNADSLVLALSLPHPSGQNIRHKSRHHGSATVQMETLQITLTLDPVSYHSIELELQPTKEYTWIQAELDCLTKFFKTQVRGALVAMGTSLLTKPWSVIFVVWPSTKVS